MLSLELSICSWNIIWVLWVVLWLVFYENILSLASKSLSTHDAHYFLIAR